PAPFFSSLIPRPPRPTLFPYTTLFRSLARPGRQRVHWQIESRGQPVRLSGCRQLRGDAAHVLDERARLGAVARVAHHADRVLNRSEEHTSELQSRFDLVCRLLLEKKKK